MSANVATAERVFKMGSVELADPAPNEPPLKALRMYGVQYTNLKRATLAPARLEGGRIVYEVEKQPVQTKGRS